MLAQPGGERAGIAVGQHVHGPVGAHVDQDGVVRLAAADGEVVDADGPMVVSNEVFRPGPAGRAVPGVSVRTDTLDELVEVGFDPGLLERPGGWWER